MWSYLVALFWSSDQIIYFDGWTAGILNDAISINIVDSLGGAPMQLDSGSRTFQITRDALDRAKQGGDDLLVTAGLFGHEIQHFNSAGSLHAEVKAYGVQYQLYDSMGLTQRENVDPAVGSAKYVHDELWNATDYELLHSPFASEYYGNLPLYRGLWFIDKSVVRPWVDFWHELGW